MVGLKSTTYASRFMTLRKGGVYVTCDFNANRVPPNAFRILLTCMFINIVANQSIGQQAKGDRRARDAGCDNSNLHGYSVQGVVFQRVVGCDEEGVLR
jgi:hypothetical protein